MKNIFTAIALRGVRCDNCSWRDNTVSSKEYKYWINKPCPKCDANILTLADYKTVRRTKILITILNITLLPWILVLWLKYKITSKNKLSHNLYKCDGSGKIKLLSKDIYKNERNQKS